MGLGSAMAVECGQRWICTASATRCARVSQSQQKWN